MEFLKMCENCMPMLKIVGAYAVVFVVNSILGVFQNVIIGNQEFKFKRIFITLFQLFIIAISAVGIVFAFEFIEDGLTQFGFNIEESLTNAISVFTFVVLFVEAFVTKAKDVFEKIKNMTDVKITIEEAKEKELKYRKPKVEVTGESAEGVKYEDYTGCEVG